MDRVVSVITSRGEQKKVNISESITTWKQLKPILMEAGYSVQSMKAVEGVTKTTLEHPEAAIPFVSFRIFLMPIDSKSGAKATKKVAAPKKAAKEPKPKAVKASRKKNKMEIEVLVEEPVAVAIEDTPDFFPEYTKEELAEEYKGIVQGIPGVKKY